MIADSYTDGKEVQTIYITYAQYCQLHWESGVNYDTPEPFNDGDFLGTFMGVELIGVN